METRDFLSRVLPDDGTYIAMSVSPKRGVTHSSSTDVDVIAERTISASEHGVDAYFALAAFKGPKRTQNNVKWLRSLFLDLDCGSGKGYSNKRKAVRSVYEFCSTTGMPLPMIVDSGNGVHVYWPFSQNVSKEEWAPAAQLLKAACVKFDLRADPAVTGDTARVLRVPGTHNYKDKENPKPVIVRTHDAVYEFADIKTVLNSLGLPPPRQFSRPVAMRERSSVTKALMGNTESSFSKIARKSLRGSGCQFIADAIKGKTEFDEPRWRAALSIAWACEDGEDAIHKLSKGHPGYDKDATIRKASETKGPYTCRVISELSPGSCNGCPLQFTSPIQLGTVHIRRQAKMSKDERDELFTEPADESEIEVAHDEEHVDTPDYDPPHPYFKSPRGIAMETKNAEGEKDSIQIYENDFYPTKIIDDPQDGMIAVFRLHLPNEHVREFNIPLCDINASDKFRSRISKEGVMGNVKQMGAIMEYSIKYVKELQEKYKAEKARMQFGWADDDSTFIVGNREYNGRGGYKSVPASSATGSLMPSLTPHGSLTEWKRIINSLAVEGLEALQLVALAGFGAPLIKFSGVLGGTLNLLSNESGTGKTTAGKIALSVYGEPESLIVIPKDTSIWKDHRLGVMNNLPCVYDEMTNVDPRELSDLIYSTPTGRGKNRMESDRNAERINSTSWSTIVLTNSNASMVSKLAKYKSRADGELMRLIELHVPKVTIPNGDEIFAGLKDHHGVAGEIYAPWIVKNRNKITEMVGRKKEALGRRVLKDQSERFWIGMLASILAGAEIAQHLQLHDLDLENLENWICEQFGFQRAATQDSIVSADSLIGEFLLEHHNEIIGISGTKNALTGTNVFLEPRGRNVVARFDATDRTMFITRKSFKDYCVERQFTMSDALEDTKQPNGPYVYIGSAKKRMTAGTGLALPPVDVLMFECSEDEAEAIQSQLMNAHMGH